MILIDDTQIKIGGILLPGLFKSVEVTHDAKVEEQEVKGTSSKPKQATGYEDAKISIEIVLYDSKKETKMKKLAKIQRLFKTTSQAKPKVHDFVCAHASIRNVRRVIFKNLTTKEQSETDKLTVSITLWEYVPVKITVRKSNNTAKKKTTTMKTTKLKNSSKKSSATTKSSSTASGLNTDYKKYLSGRGSAPKAKNKTESSPALVPPDTSSKKEKLSNLKI